jgi:hypothetical protein
MKPSFLGHFSTVKVVDYFEQQMGWDKFWAKYSQTHLVTLVAADR